MKKKKDVLERIISAKRREVEFHKANIPEEVLLDSTAARARKRSHEGSSFEGIALWHNSRIQAVNPRPEDLSTGMRTLKR